MGRGRPLPMWVDLIQAAKWAGIPPWELAKQPVQWYYWISDMMAAEDAAHRSNRGGSLPSSNPGTA